MSTIAVVNSAPGLRVVVFAACGLLLSGCAPGRTPPAATLRSLPADSAQILARALASARPAYSTQEEALRAGVYRAAGTTRSADASQSVSSAGPVASAPAAATVPPSAAGTPERTDPERTDPAVRTRTPPAAEDAGPTSRPRSEGSGPTLRGSGYVVQVAAFRDLPSATRTALEAGRSLPGLEVAVEEDQGLFRVVLGGWPDEESARERLVSVRQLYPSAWVRRRAVP